MIDAPKPAVGGPGYHAMTNGSLTAYLGGFAHIAATLGGGPEDWSVTEVGDGNLNLVFVVRGPKKGLVVKQALPYVRLVGESWPLPLDRSFFESQALLMENKLAPGLAPEVFLVDNEQALVVM